MAEGYPSLLAYKNNSLAFLVIPIYVATRIARHSRTVKMSGIEVTIPLQMVCRLMIATQVGQNVTLPLNWNSTLVRNETLPVNRQPEVVTVNKTDLPVRPYVYVAFPEFGFAYKLIRTRFPYDTARRECFEDNGQLAVIDSTEKVENILNHFNYGESIWVGLYRAGYSEEWTTIDGKSTNNLPWKSGYPSGESRKCVSILKSDKGLKNRECALTYSFMCEIALPRNRSETRMEQR